MQAGETLLVQGGSSGIGVTAIQLGQGARRARSSSRSGSDEKAAACIALGADHAINYKTHDFAAEVKRLTDGRGVDVILDMVAGDYVARELTCLADDGRLVIIAMQGGNDAQIDAGQVLRRRLTITGSTLRPRPVAFKAAIARRLRAQGLAAGWKPARVKPVISRCSRPSRPAQAHALMESNQHIGKLVLTW